MSDYAVQLATKAFEILSSTDGLANDFTTFRRAPMLTVKSGDLPILGVYILREQRTADGDANAGVPKFVHRLTLGFSGAVNVETDEENKLTDLEEVMTKLDDLLLTNAKFVSMTEGVLSMDRVSQYSKIGEISIAEIRVEMTVQFRSQYEPVIADDFKTLHITLRYPKPTTDNAVEPIVREYDFPQN
jgi:hypothetical protein